MSFFLSAVLVLQSQQPTFSTADLEKALRQARTAAIAPRAEPPAWMDYERVKRGYFFFGKHARTIVQVLGTSSLASTYAAKDVTPVVMQTQRMPKDFNQRMIETEQQTAKILIGGGASLDGFLKRNYPQAVSLGKMHAEVGEAVKGQLKWDPKVRVPMNGQSFAFVLYSFAWWPVEAMEATKELDVAANAQDVDDWFYLWSVIGYGMGVPEALLPTSYARAKELMPMLRAAQYVKKGEKIPDGIPELLSAHVRQLAGRAAAKNGTSSEAETPGAAKMLAGLISYSPQLGDALGLGADPAARLVEYSKAKY